MHRGKLTTYLRPVERRDSSRIAVHVPIEVTLTDSRGKQATERAFIEDVSSFGCRFSVRADIQQGATVTLKVLGKRGMPDDEPRMFEVMWVQRRQNTSTIGARLIEGEKLDKVKEASPDNPDTNSGS